MEKYIYVCANCQGNQDFKIIMNLQHNKASGILVRRHPDDPLYAYQDYLDIKMDIGL